MKYNLGIDIGGTKIAYGLFNEQKDLVAKRKKPTDTHLGVKEFFDAVCEELYAFLREQGVSFSQVAGIGIGMPSFIDFKKGYVIKTGSIPQIQNFPLRDYMREKLGDAIKIVIDNDGNVGALAEARYGAGRAYDHMVFCSVSTGIGSRIIINGTLFRGTYGWAGESGHMLVGPPGEYECLCGCGNANCLNSYCSGKMIVDHVQEWISEGEETILPELAGGADRITPIHLDQAYDLGDMLATKAVEYMAQYMAVWLFNVYLTLNINCFVFSGGLLAMGDKLFGRVRDLFNQYNQHNDPEKSYPVHFFQSQLGGDTGIYGALELLF